MNILHITDSVAKAPPGRDTHLRLFAARSDALGHENRIVSRDEVARSGFGDISGGSREDVVILHGRQTWSEAHQFAGSRTLLAWAHDQSFVCPASISWFRNTRKACALPVGPWCVWNAYTKHCNARHPLNNLRNVASVVRTRRRTRSIQGVIVASEYMRQRFISGGVDQDLLHVVPYHVRIPDLAQPSPSASDKRVLYFGRVNEMKGVDVLIDAIALLPPDVTLHVAGEGPGVPALKEKAQQLGLGPARVTFDGYLPDPEAVARVFADSAMVAVPSLWPEPFGIVGLEALARGKPVVASNVGGIPEWLADGQYGYLVPPDDPAALARRIADLAGSPAKATEMGMRGRERVRKTYSWDAHWAKFQSVVERTIAATAASRAREEEAV